MTATTVPPVRTNAQTPKQHLSALLAYLEPKVATLRTNVRNAAAELAMAEEDLRAHEEMLEQTRRWWEEGLLTT